MKEACINSLPFITISDIVKELLIYSGVSMNYAIPLMNMPISAGHKEQISFETLIATFFRE